MRKRRRQNSWKEEQRRLEKYGRPVIVLTTISQISSRPNKITPPFISCTSNLFNRQGCSARARPLICSAFLPLCHPLHPHLHILPCRHLCNAVKMSCIHIFQLAALPWPKKLNCTAFPKKPQLCLAPEFSTPRPHFSSSSPSTPSLSTQDSSAPPTQVTEDPSAPSSSFPHLSLVNGLPLSLICLITLLFWFIFVCYIHPRQAMRQPGQATVTFSPQSPSPAPSPTPRPLPTPPLPADRQELHFNFLVTPELHYQNIEPPYAVSESITPPLPPKVRSLTAYAEIPYNDTVVLLCTNPFLELF